MKNLKIVVISILSIFAAISVILYLAFLFVLPKTIDLNKYESQITKAIKENSGIQVEFENLKLKTSWDLSAGFLTKKVDLSYETGEKFAQINDLGVDISLWHLIFKDIKINRVSAKKVMANIDLSKKLTVNKKQKSNNIKLSTKMPAIYADKYRISLISGTNNYTIKGSDLKITDFKLDEKIKLSSSGELILNSRKQISYNLAVFSEILPWQKGKKTTEKFDYLKVFDELYKYNLNSEVNANLNILKNSDVNGKITFDKLFFVMGGKTFPKSTINLDFAGDKIKINTNLYTDINSKALITGFYKSGKHRAIDLKIKTDRTNLENVFLIANNLLKVFGRKTLEQIGAQGFAKADFNVKSDFKKVQSSGYLKIDNAKLTHKIHKVSIDKINAYIDFSKNNVLIKEASAELNSQPVKIEGNIDKSANADILVTADNLHLKSILFSLGKSNLLKENDFEGIVDVKASLIGRLDKAVPKVDVVANNIRIKNRSNDIKIEKVTVNEQNNNGNAKISGVSINQTSPFAISAPEISAVFDKQNLSIIPTHIYINGVKADLSGKISNISSTLRLNPVKISVPNQISVPIKGFSNSNMVLKGDIELTGNINAPQIQGQIEIPSIKIPTASPNALTYLKNTTIKFGKEINLNCPEIKIANSNINLSAQIDKNFPLTARNVKFNADNFDLNVLIPVFNNLSKVLPTQTNSKGLTVINGKNRIGNFKVGRIDSSGVSSDLSFKNNVLYLTNLNSTAYFGEIKGDINYDFNNRKTTLDIQGRGLSASPALIAIMGRDNDIHGVLDFDGDVSLVGYSKYEMLKSLKGDIVFIITNGKMGMLGKLEHLIYAQNIVSNNIFKASLSLIAKALTAKNTGVYKYMKGKISFDNGWANINQIKTSGPSMSLYITGRYYMPENIASLIMLGRISDDVVRVLGPIGDFSVDKAVSYIPKSGDLNALFLNQFRTNPVYENTAEIPQLTPKTQFQTKEFKVFIDGDVQKQTSVKSFKWIAKPAKEESLPPPAVNKPPVQELPAQLPDFVKNLPDYKN